MTDINEFPTASTPEFGAEQPMIATAALFIAAAQLAAEAEHLSEHFYYYTGARDAFEAIFAASKNLGPDSDPLFEADIDLAGLAELERDALLFNCRSMMTSGD